MTAPHRPHPSHRPHPAHLPHVPHPSQPSRGALEAVLDDKGRSWLDAALTEATVGLPSWKLSFAAAGRGTGPEHADDVRVLILTEARADVATLTLLYQQGTAAERRAVLRALPVLVADSAAALPLVEDALRTNDTSLVAAAVGPYGAGHLTPHAWRHAVLKCLFTGVSVAAVADLDARARGDAELSRMLTDYAAERTAAGRPVPADLHRVLAATRAHPEPGTPGTPGAPDASGTPEARVAHPAPHPTGEES